MTTEVGSRSLDKRGSKRSPQVSSARRKRKALGNFPRAFSHLALVEAAELIILPERLAELNG